MKVSVIVPVYNVEAYITRCARSLFEQTLLTDIEFVFVDDASPDDSIGKLNELIAQYPSRRNQVKIVPQSVNQGLPAARNRGLQMATGEYVYHCDSDDYLVPFALEKLLETALLKDADYVWSDWYLVLPKNTRYMRQPSFSTKDEALRCMLAGGMKYNVWNKLVKRSLYVDNAIEFPEGYGMGEDMTMIRLLACADCVAYVPHALYYYVKRGGDAFTNCWNETHLASLKHNTKLTIDYLQKKAPDSLDREIAWFKLGVKLPFLISDETCLYNLWTDFYPEANSYIWSNKFMSWRIRTLQLLALSGFWNLVRLHYVVVYKFLS